MIKTKFEAVVFFSLIFCAILGIFAFQGYIQKRYTSLVQTPHFVDDFSQVDTAHEAVLKEKYGVDFARVRDGKIVVPAGVALPKVDLVKIIMIKNPLVLQYSVKDSLLLTRPYVFWKPISLNIIFPLFFPDKREGFLIIKQILP